MSDIDRLYEAVVDGDAKRTVSELNAVLAAGVEPQRILQQGMLDAMKEVGQLFEEGEFFVPEMLIAARAMAAGLEILRPHLVDQGVSSPGKVVIGTVAGDLHDIGKSLVVMMLEGAGFEVVDLGIDVAASRFVEATVEHAPHIVAMSALLTTTMANMRQVIEALESAGVRDGVAVLIGGAPITQGFADEIGADGFAPNASAAPRAAAALVAAAAGGR